MALAEACAEHVPRELLERVPEGGFSQGQLHRLLDRTEFQGLAFWADMWKQDAGTYFRPVGYSLNPFAPAGLNRGGLVIGCVDNALALAAMTARRWHWWADAGNGENWGQVLIGNAGRKDLRDAFAKEKGTCSALPLPTLQQPELLAGRPPPPDCADAVQAGEQGPLINQAMAALVLEVVRRIIAGTCPWMQVYIDLDAGTLRAVPATPEAAARITGLKEKTLIKKGVQHERG